MSEETMVLHFNSPRARLDDLEENSWDFIYEENPLGCIYIHMD